MDQVINFFTLRPVFTHYGIKVIWYLYLLNAAIRVYAAFNTVFQVLAQKGISWEAWSPNFIPIVLGIVVQLALVRLLLEIAAIILAGADRPSEQIFRT